MFKKEQREKGFICSHCKIFIPVTSTMGTAHRNHCNQCLWSKHVDKKPGDRQSNCQAGMEPIGITLKHGGKDKYGKERLGDVMLIHRCTGCNAIVINRVAADDPADTIINIFNKSQNLPKDVQDNIKKQRIDLMQGDTQKQMVMERLYGK